VRNPDQKKKHKKKPSRFFQVNLKKPKKKSWILRAPPGTKRKPKKKALRKRKENKKILKLSPRI
jgi:hypothetical protein